MMTHADFNLVSVVRPYEQIVAQVQQAIRDNRYPRGSKLPTERELAESFGVSRSVVREAIKVLAANGLVESRQGSGIFVRNDPIPTVTRAFTLSVSPDAESLDKLFEFRCGLETEAARLAALRRAGDQVEAMREALALAGNTTPRHDWDTFGESDSRFHRLVAEASGNPYLVVAVATARDMQRDVVRLFSESPGRMDVAINHHLAILEAIATGDSERSAKAMTAHIRYTSDMVQTELPRVDRHRGRA
jgi:GntR family transcriptional repressor for pyruvate dehydrogenase complex